MKPDHEAAKKWAEETWNTLKNIVLDDVTEADAIEYRNAARAYLDLLAQRDEALALLRRVANWEHSSEPMHAVMGAARAFLAKTKGSQ